MAVLNCFLSTKRSVIVPMLLLLGYIFVNKGIFTRKNLIRGIGLVIIGIVLYINVPVVRDVYHSNIETALFSGMMIWLLNMTLKGQIKVCV